MFNIEMVEGKDHPPQIEETEYDKMGKTVGLLVHLCSSLFSTGKVVILDSGFCVLKGLIELRKLGVFASALIKKDAFGQRASQMKPLIHTLQTNLLVMWIV